MSKFLDYIFLELIHTFCKLHWKTHNDKQIYMQINNMKQEEIERVEVYYEWMQKLIHGIQVPTIDSFLTIVFKAGLQSYFGIATTGMKRSTLQQHKEVAMLCENGMTTAETRSALSIPQNTK